MSSHSKKIVSLKANFISDSTSYSGIVENLSEDSLYIRAVPEKPAVDLVPGKTLEVSFKSDRGTSVSLLCRVKWSYKTPPHGLTNSLGMEILNSDPDYEKLLQIL
jgi:hypothetical protein